MLGTSPCDEMESQSGPETTDRLHLDSSTIYAYIDDHTVLRERPALTKEERCDMLTVFSLVIVMS